MSDCKPTGTNSLEIGVTVKGISNVKDLKKKKKKKHLKKKIVLLILCGPHHSVSTLQVFCYSPDVFRNIKGS